MGGSVGGGGGAAAGVNVTGPVTGGGACDTLAGGCTGAAAVGAAVGGAGGAASTIGATAAGAVGAALGATLGAGAVTAGRCCCTTAWAGARGALRPTAALTTSVRDALAAIPSPTSMRGSRLARPPNENVRLVAGCETAASPPGVRRRPTRSTTEALTAAVASHARAPVSQSSSRKARAATARSERSRAAVSCLLADSTAMICSTRHRAGSGRSAVRSAPAVATNTVVAILRSDSAVHPEDRACREAPLRVQRPSKATRTPAAVSSPCVAPAACCLCSHSNTSSNRSSDAGSGTTALSARIAPSVAGGGCAGVHADSSAGVGIHGLVSGLASARCLGSAPRRRDACLGPRTLCTARPSVGAIVPRRLRSPVLAATASRALARASSAA